MGINGSPSVLTFKRQASQDFSVRLMVNRCEFVLSVKIFRPAFHDSFHMILSV
ncbi:hypothetical protein HOLleu_01553 [Holothuria leucospilota]|uniref:Uncharacterized protein n=1 Tax=Holothuria leucospilota TaxID=206669 RepID=A0A9Q1CQG8_HOLLE|nr:hypothetical protein HOLleu_01553 [Holothuria leucospilota]